MNPHPTNPIHTPPRIKPTSTRNYPKPQAFQDGGLIAAAATPPPPPPPIDKGPTTPRQWRDLGKPNLPPANVSSRQYAHSIGLPVPEPD